MRKGIIILILIMALAGVISGRMVAKHASEGKSLELEPIFTEEPKAQVEDKPNTLAPLKEGIQKELAEYEGEWAVYVENLTSGDSFEINNKRMVSASLIKLFIMGKTFEEIENGIIKKEDVASSLRAMITVSDNEASNVLVAALGGGKYTDMQGEAFQKGLKEVNGFAEKHECIDTEQQRDMKNARPKPITEQNYTSVADCGKFMSKLYHGKLVSIASDAEMLQLLKQQTRTGKIPNGLPDGTICANKTGELSDVENDVAIIFTPGADYVLCVMSNDVPDVGVARNRISHISNMVYEFLN